VYGSAEVWMYGRRNVAILKRVKVLNALYSSICGSLVKIMHHPEKWCGPSILKEEVKDYDANDGFDQQ
jgi:hypothetical protein